MTDKEAMRLLYLENLDRGVFPIVPAYHFYATKIFGASDLLTLDDFETKLTQHTSESIDFLGEKVPPDIDIDYLYSLLDEYYEIFYLYYNEKLILVY